jgi:two-component system OmpR family response regulator
LPEVRVLLIEDDTTIGSAVRDHVAILGHAVDWSQDIETDRDFMAVAEYDLMLLDLGLPDGRGIDLLKGIRRKGTDAAVMILSLQDQIAVKIEGLNAGADDYLIKPFDLGELGARVPAAARRYIGRPANELVFGPISIDSANRMIARDGIALNLTSREWAVLDRLTRTNGAVVSKTDIETALYSFGAEVESNTVEVYVSRLRRKLATFTEKLPQLSRADAGVGSTPGRQNLSPILTAVVDEFRGRRLNPVDITVQDDLGQDIQVAMDVDAFAIVMPNLIENATLHGARGAAHQH